ncbi:MAG: hypothetical protein INR66_11355 [Gordonia polyisoprenivorans]|nr:hypothetical protein [Gordonia polyisoprenivorans]
MASNRFHSGTYSTYRHHPDGSITLETGVHSPEGPIPHGEPELITAGAWAGPNDFDPLNPYSR